MGWINQTQFIMLFIALISVYIMAEFYYDMKYGPEVDLTEVDLQEIYSDETAKTTTATSSSPSSPATVEPGKEEKYDDFNDTDPEKNASTRPLIMYAYSETENARENLRFFLAQGLHGAADFVFILNGETDVGEALIPQKTNIAVVKRPNTCYDLGAHGEVLRNGDLWKRYGRFVLLNASVRGPFVPYWSRACWSDAYLGRVTDEVKLVGMTANCQPQFHIQSMIWATDSIGMELLLYPRQRPDGSASEVNPVALQGCYNERNVAINAEVQSAAMIREAGYEVDAMMAAYHKNSSSSSSPSSSEGEGRSDYAASCGVPEAAGGAAEGDVLFGNTYFGSNVHPYETIFIKANRNIDPLVLDLLTDWHLSGPLGGGSWDVCG